MNQRECAREPGRGNSVIVPHDLTHREQRSQFPSSRVKIGLGNECDSYESLLQARSLPRVARCVVVGMFTHPPSNVSVGTFGSSQLGSDVSNPVCRSAGCL